MMYPAVGTHVIVHHFTMDANVRRCPSVPVTHAFTVAPALTLPPLKGSRITPVFAPTATRGRKGAIS